MTNIGPDGPEKGPHGMTWQPIETAPKDGNEIIAADVRTGWVGCVQWGRTQYHGDGWLDGYDFGNQSSYSSKPQTGITHWMPLPEPPADGPAGQPSE